MQRMPCFEKLESKDLLTAYLLNDTNLAPARSFQAVSMPGSESSYFLAKAPNSQMEIWKSDGTVEGTEVIGATDPGRFVAKLPGPEGHIIIFGTQSNSLSPEFSVWSVHGGDSNKLGVAPGYPWQWVEYDSGIAFPAGESGTTDLLWTDGQQLLTLASNIPAGELLSVDRHLLVRYGDELWEYRNGELQSLDTIVDADSSDFIVHNDLLFQMSFGDEQGTLFAVPAPDFVPQRLTAFTEWAYPLRDSPTTGAFYFSLQDPAGSSTLWQSDATLAGTREVVRLPGHRILDVAVDGDSIYLSTQHTEDPGRSVFVLEEGNLEELMVSSAAFRFKDYSDSQVYWESLREPGAIYSRRDGQVVSVHSQSEGQFIDITNEFELVASPGETFHQINLVAVDSATGERRQLQTLQTSTASGWPRQFAFAHDRLFFSAIEGDFISLFAFDGEEYQRLLAGAYFVESYELDKGPAFYVHFERESRLYVTVDDPIRLIEVNLEGVETRWPHIDIHPSAVKSYDGNLLVIDGDEAWAVDPTNAEKKPELIATSSSFFLSRSFVGSDFGFFYFVEPGFGTQIWATDGTREGTHLVTQSDRTSPFRELAVFEDDLFFIRRVSDASNEVNRWNLRTDKQERLGEIEGDIRFVTTEIGVFIIASTDNSSVLMTPNLETILEFGGTASWLETVASGNELFISEVASNEGRRIWRTDGTANGTELVFQTTEPQRGSNLVTLNGLVYFHNQTQDHDQVWATDGTNANTFVYEFPRNPEVELSEVELAVYQSQVFVSAYSPQFGTELWAITGPSSIPNDIDGDGRVGFEDFLQLSNQYLQEGVGLTADLDHDGDVDFTDFLQFSADFGSEKRSIPESALDVIEPRRVDLAMMDF